MSELEAQVGAPEAIDGDGQFDDLAPAGAVVVVEHEGAVLRHVGLPRTQTDAVLQGAAERRMRKHKGKYLKLTVRVRFSKVQVATSSSKLWLVLLY